MTSPCILCGASDVAEVFAWSGVPVLCNRLWPDRDSARRAPAGDIHLVFCRRCALLFNRSFDSARIAYDHRYENALHFSSTFQAYAEELATHLVTKYRLRGKKVVEIGCGDGHMLELLAGKGVDLALGYDPSASKRAELSLPNNVRLVPEYFAGHLEVVPDAILCRHVLEHLPDPSAFLLSLRDALGDRDCAVYFEVPNGQWVIDSHDPWDVIYEHVTYWTGPAITTLFRRSGFEVLEVSSGYAGQFLRVEAIPGRREEHCLPHADSIAAISKSARSFADVSTVDVNEWRCRLRELAQRDGRSVIWGAGSKGITFANLMASATSNLAAIVDINPRKWGMAAPIVGLPVISPNDLPLLHPDLILIANAQYQAEILALVSQHALTPEFSVIAR